MSGDDKFSASPARPPASVARTSGDVKSGKPAFAGQKKPFVKRSDTAATGGAAKARFSSGTSGHATVRHVRGAGKGPTSEASLSRKGHGPRKPFVPRQPRPEGRRTPAARFQARRPAPRGRSSCRRPLPQGSASAGQPFEKRDGPRNPFSAAVPARANAATRFQARRPAPRRRGTCGKTVSQRTSSVPEGRPFETTDHANHSATREPGLGERR